MAGRAPIEVEPGTELERVPCGLCGSWEETLLFVKDGFRIVKCDRCGLVRVNPRLTRQRIADQYDEQYYTQGSYSDYLSERPGYEATFERRLARIERLVPAPTSGQARRRILDVGCAYGFFLGVAERRGWEAHGLDLSPVGCRYAVEELGVRALCSTIAEAGFAEGFFDVVIMNDTFEHLADPLGDLVQARRVLRPGGYLFLVTQDTGRPLVRLLGRRWAQYKPREHLYYYTATTLRQMLDRAGFQVLKIEDEGLVCTIDFLVTKIGNLSRPVGRGVGQVVRALGIGRRLVPVRTGYEVMVTAQKPGEAIK